MEYSQKSPRVVRISPSLLGGRWLRGVFREELTIKWRTTGTLIWARSLSPRRENAGPTLPLPRLKEQRGIFPACNQVRARRSPPATMVLSETQNQVRFTVGLVRQRGPISALKRWQWMMMMMMPMIIWALSGHFFSRIRTSMRRSWLYARTSVLSISFGRVGEDSQSLFQTQEKS